MLSKTTKVLNFALDEKIGRLTCKNSESSMEEYDLNDKITELMYNIILK